MFLPLFRPNYSIVPHLLYRINLSPPKRLEIWCFVTVVDLMR